MPEARIVEEIKKRFPSDCQDEIIIEKLVQTVVDRISVWSDIDTMVKENEIQYFFHSPVISKEMIVWKKGVILQQGSGQAEIDAKENLYLVLNILEKFESNDQTKADIMKITEAKGKGNVLWPLRVALSGKEKSPDPFTLLSILGKEKSIERIQSVINILQ